MYRVVCGYSSLHLGKWSDSHVKRYFDLPDQDSQAKYKPCSPELLAILGDNVKRIRKERGMSQEALADAAGMHRTFISLIERRGRNVTLGVVEALANALKVEVPDLLS
ncbi:helix-turn-helix transcriptional regulator [uncultured Pseudoteredinibacter sp.]|uniref:helix-turn-helix domain-containing protein n=1 Tax=uncultured Pseudoteredinibacter sp. TaxID=1641701 RepID=UPI002631F0B4|nr:helix-turn-helix transcriptional regulator [uncultured Pseudoteredinibacter sp.]